MTSSLVGASVWEEKVYEHLVSHEANEQGGLADYQEAADASQSLAFKYLASLIIEDEHRHHRIFAELAESLRVDAELRPEDPAVPRLDRWGPDARRLVELTERLLEQEHRDAKALQHLARELGELKDTTMWTLLVEIMEMDTAKHIKILDFVRDHARHFA